MAGPELFVITEFDCMIEKEWLDIERDLFCAIIQNGF
jgi:hypothetical protein